MPPNPRADRYNHTPRKVFDKGMDGIKLRILRVKEDYRADMASLVARLILLEEAVEELMDPLGKDFQKEEQDDLLFQLPDGRWRRKANKEEL